MIGDSCYIYWKLLSKMWMIIIQFNEKKNIGKSIRNYQKLTNNSSWQWIFWSNDSLINPNFKNIIVELQKITGFL